jgi:hypothetical protein
VSLAAAAFIVICLLHALFGDATEVRFASPVNPDQTNICLRLPAAAQPQLIVIFEHCDAYCLGIGRPAPGGQNQLDISRPEAPRKFCEKSEGMDLKRQRLPKKGPVKY